jgi:transcriptional regulator with XRE-family HTH domain
MQLRIREWRQHFQLSQAALAAESGLSRETISAIENNRQAVDTNQLEAMATALHLRVSDLLDESPCPQCPFRQGPPPPSGPGEEPTGLTVHRTGQAPALRQAPTAKARARALRQRGEKAYARSVILLERLGPSAGVVLLTILPWVA